MPKSSSICFNKGSLNGCVCVCMCVCVRARVWHAKRNIHEAKKWQTAVAIWSVNSLFVRGKRAKLFLLTRFKFLTSSPLSTGHIFTYSHTAFTYTYAFFYFYTISYHSPSVLSPSVLWRCWLGGRKGIRPVKNSWCHSLPPASEKSRLVFSFLVPAHLGSPRKGC